METPWNTTIEIAKNSDAQNLAGAMKFNAFSVQSAVAALDQGNLGVPAMGTVAFTLDFSADMHDDKNVTYDIVSTLLKMSLNPSKANIRKVRVTYWKDEKNHNPYHADDVLLTITFDGWISACTVASGGGANHTLSVTFMPRLDSVHFNKVELGN